MVLNSNNLRIQRLLQGKHNNVHNKNVKFYFQGKKETRLLKVRLYVNNINYRENSIQPCDNQTQVRCDEKLYLW